MTCDAFLLNNKTSFTISEKIKLKKKSNKHESKLPKIIEI